MVAVQLWTIFKVSVTLVEPGGDSPDFIRGGRSWMI